MLKQNQAILVLKFSFNDIEFESRLIEGQFPNLKMILNADYHIRANINRQKPFICLRTF